MEWKEFQEHIKEFLLYLEAERHVSSHTLRAYQTDLKQFLKFWQTTPSVKELSLRRIVERYLVSLFYKKIGKNSIARKFSCFKSLERFLKTHSIHLNLNLQRPRIEKKLPVYLSTDEMTHLLDTVKDHNLPTKSPLRDRAILELLYATGVRCAELVNIKLEDINMEQKTIRIFGKGKKERMVLFGNQAKKRLELYIKHERPITQTEQEPLFLSTRFNPMNCRNVQRVIQMFRLFLKIERPITPHKIRHSFATHLLNKGMDLRLVKELLGHERLSSTEQYTHVSLENLKQMCNSLHPIHSMKKQTDTE